MRPLIAEAFGTFALVFAGTGAITINAVTSGSVTHVGIALTFGLIVMAMIFALGPISGAHMNPAVTCALALAGRFPRNRIGSYIIAQCIGALAASLTLRLMFPAAPTLGQTLPLGEGMHALLRAWTLEALLTFVLMLVILRVTMPGREVAITPAIAIGGVVALEALFAGPVTGASMNPARSLAPALISGVTQHLWIYLTAPIAGACLAVFIARSFEPANPPAFRA